MTIQGAIDELMNLLDADDVPIYYKPSIEKVIDTIILERARRKAIVAYIDEPNNRKTEPQRDCDNCKHKGYEGCEQPCLGCGWCDDYEPKDEPQTEREGE